jgi:hypothetical protein
MRCPVSRARAVETELLRELAMRMEMQIRARLPDAVR